MQFMQVLLNLGLNARDALDDGPHTIAFEVTLGKKLPALARLEVGCIPNVRHAIIRVEDTGSGISPEIRSRLWEPYFTTKQARGTGLGLAVIAEIVRDAGGGIALESVPGVGSAFYVAWPLIQKDELEKQRPVSRVAA
jgi:signal transduction histidine kinase